MNNIDDDLKLKIAKVNRANPYVDITRQELKVTFPKILYDSFFPKSNEIVIFVAPAKIFKDKEKVVGHTGKSAGASIRVAKGVSIRTGSSGGKAIREVVRNNFDGDLIITNKRILFIGKDEHFEFSVNKISAVKLLSKTSFLIQSGKNSKNIEIDENIISYTYGYINFVVKAEANGDDLYKNINEELEQVSNEELEYCDKISEEVKNIKIPEKNKKQNLSNEEKVLRNIKYFCIFIILLILFGMSINKSNDENSLIYPYTDTEIINLDNHPKIMENFQEAEALYYNVDKEKVMIYDLKKEKTTCNNNEDKYLIYMDNATGNYNIISEILLNLNVSDEFKTVTLEEAIKIAVDYLPMDILNQYYQKERAYIKEYDTVKSYHYAWKLNNSGIDYYNSGHNELLNKFGLKIEYNKTTNTYKVIINVLVDDISPLGVYDEEWYKENTQQWNINLNEYIN